jgi:hypothetical protein
VQARRNSISDLPGSQFGSELLDVDNQVEEVRIGGIVVEVLLDECSTVRIGFLHVIAGFLEIKVPTLHDLLHAVFVAGDESHSQATLPRQ